jgi:hypothetical protein
VNAASPIPTFPVRNSDAVSEVTKFGFPARPNWNSFGPRYEVQRALLSNRIFRWAVGFLKIKSTSDTHVVSKIAPFSPFRLRSLSIESPKMSPFSLSTSSRLDAMVAVETFLNTRSCPIVLLIRATSILLLRIVSG